MKDTSTWRSLEITATQTNRPRANPPSTRVTECILDTAKAKKLKLPSAVVARASATPNCSSVASRTTVSHLRASSRAVLYEAARRRNARLRKSNLTTSKSKKRKTKTSGKLQSKSAAAKMATIKMQNSRAQRRNASQTSTARQLLSLKNKRHRRKLHVASLQRGPNRLLWQNDCRAHFLCTAYGRGPGRCTI